MNMMRSDRTRAITARALLGEAFFKDEAPLFKSREDWEKNKADIEKMASFHAKVFGQLKRGERAGTAAKDALKES
jgi:hypothetical protein